jgi:hypothetical protein
MCGLPFSLVGSRRPFEGVGLRALPLFQCLGGSDSSRPIGSAVSALAVAPYRLLAGADLAVTCDSTVGQLRTTTVALRSYIFAWLADEVDAYVWATTSCPVFDIHAASRSLTTS